MVFRLAALFILFIAMNVSSAVDQPGRFEMSEEGQTYWLPDWMSFNLYPDFKTRLLENQLRPSTETLQCRKSYEKLLNKRDIQWSIYFGYGDGDGDEYTTDPAEYNLFAKELTSRCGADEVGVQVCGFEIEKGQPGQYVKQIQTKQKNVINIHLRLFQSSLTSFFQTNLNSREQKRKSKILESSFLRSLHTDDIVFYSGHARNGAGPGFRPLVKKTKDWWIATLFRPMVTTMMHSLNPVTNDSLPVNIVTNAQVIGLLSCESEAHYGPELARNASDSSFILTRQTISATDNMRLLYAATHSLLAEDCEPAFQNNLKQAISTIFYDKRKGPPANLDDRFPQFFNFFKKDTLKGRNDILLYLDHADEVSMELNRITY